jgi:nitrous oxidase accessory protein NosD
LTFEVNPSGGHNPNHVLRSSDIHFSHSSFHGSLNNDPSDDKNGLFVQNSQNVSVSYSEFQQLGNGLVHSASQGLEFVGNSFHDIRSDGIKGGGSSDILISQNYFRDFYPASGDHPDAIQFMTMNSTSSASNIRILDNVIVQGNGKIIQGIFMGNELSIPYKDVTISGNFVSAGQYHGITIHLVGGVQVHDNTVLSSLDRKAPIRVSGATDAEVAGNSALLVYLNSQDITAQGNTKLAAVSDGGQLALQNWMATHSASLDDLPDVLGSGAAKVRSLKPSRY